jgi:hypothetical protein
MKALNTIQGKSDKITKRLNTHLSDKRREIKNTKGGMGEKEVLMSELEREVILILVQLIVCVHPIDLEP